MSSGARKAPPGTRSATRSTYAAGSLVDPHVYEKLSSNKDKKPIRISVKAKASIPSQTNAGNWQTSKSANRKPKLTNGSPKKAKPTAVGPPTPPMLVNPVDSRVLASFPCGKPFEVGSDMIQCKHCRKPVFKPAAPEHIRDCLKKKQEKAQKKKEAKEAKEAAQRKERNGGISPEPALDTDGRKTMAGRLAGGLDGAKKTSKKRKADSEAGPKKKRKKDEPKKTGRQKGPVDVERQCGVLMPNGQMCARSLTCKTHAMGLKRAVPGRSMRYDILLAQYQKKNHAKQHRAAMEASGPAPEDIEDPAEIDSEEERDTVMAAISNYYQDDPFTGTRVMGAPLSSWDPAPLQRRYNFIRLKGALKSAIDSVHGSRIFSIASLGSGLFSGISSDELDIDLDAANETDNDEMDIEQPSSNVS